MSKIKIQTLVGGDETKNIQYSDPSGGAQPGLPLAKGSPKDNLAGYDEFCLCYGEGFVDR